MDIRTDGFGLLHGARGGTKQNAHGNPGNATSGGSRSKASYSGFTLIELLVVVSIIALLISILLPSLKAARSQAKTVVCAANQRHVGQSMSTYTSEFRGAFPPSYVYPNEFGGWDWKNQDVTHPYGYTHWSWFLYENGQADQKAFQCPEMQNGGAPRTNPGPKRPDWEPGQVDQNGSSNPNSLVDKQAPRMAYTANAAVVPRNKFDYGMVQEQLRRNIFPKDDKIKSAGNTALATEFLDHWEAISESVQGRVEIKSHRSINPFFNTAAGNYNSYAAEPRETKVYSYGPLTPEGQSMYDVVKLRAAMNRTGTLEENTPDINAVGRHHPGGADRNTWGGTANFLFVDGHVELMTPLQSMQDRKWGNAYYALEGADNKIRNMNPIRF